MAKELEIPVVVLAQLNRGAETGEGPKISHLRESGAIEADADIIGLLDRDRHTEGAISPATIVIAKNRNGPVDTINLEFHEGHTRFESCTRNWADLSGDF